MTNLIFNEGDEKSSQTKNLELMPNDLDLKEIDQGEEQLTVFQDSEQVTGVLDSLGIETSPDELEHLFTQAVLAASNFGNAFISGINRIPTWMRVLIPLQLVFISIAAIIFGVLVGIWAKTALLYGIKQADQASEEDWQLVEAVKLAYQKLKSMLWMVYVPAIKIIVWIAGGVIGVVIVASVLSAILSDYNLLAALVTIPVVTGMILWLIHKILHIVIAQILGKWVLVNEDQIKAKDAFAPVSYTHLTLPTKRIV